MSWFALILSLSGNVLVIKKRRSGFAYWTLANVIWFADALRRGDCAQATLWTVYLVLSVWGWMSWGRAGRADAQAVRAGRADAQASADGE